MDFHKSGIAWSGGGVPYLRLSSNWIDSWNFCFGQLMKEYLRKDEIAVSDKSFEQKQIKDTTKKIGKNTYRETVEAWVKKNNACRLNAEGREKLEERFKMFLKSLKGFTDWDTVKGWEAYQLKRLEAYKNLTKRDKDLPKSLTTRKEIRNAEENERGREDDGDNEEDEEENEED